MKNQNFFEVNEAGTVAAAATEIDADMGFSLFGDEPPPPPVFCADHPFLVAVAEGDQLYFVGIVKD